jgi:hypothetical protein
MVVKSGGKNSGGDKPLGVLSLAIRFIHEAREEMNYPSKLRGIDPQRSDPLRHSLAGGLTGWFIGRTITIERVLMIAAELVLVYRACCRTLSAWHSLDSPY